MCDKKWIAVNDLPSGQYSDNKNIRFKTSMPRSNLCDYSDAYIVVKGTITVEGTNNANTRNKKLTFKNHAPFRSCISKINNKFIGNAENLDIVMSMYNLLEYSDNYSKTSGNLLSYYRNEINDSTNENNDGKICEIFEYKTKIIEKTLIDNYILDAEVVVLLKYLSNFWRPLDLLLINCEIELDLSWSRYCIIFEIPRPPAVPTNPPVPSVETTHTTRATFQINNAKLFELLTCLQMIISNFYKM